MKTNLSLLAGIILVAFSFASCKKDDNKEETFEVIEMSTAHGTAYIWLFDATPLHKANFLKLAKEGFYDGTTFHRCLDSFMIQGGDPNSKDSDPNNDGQGGPGYTIPSEINKSSTHMRGSLAAARLGDAQNPERASSGSQFYIVQSTNGTKHLNGAYTVYGFVMKGIEMVDKVLLQPANGNGRPNTDIPMEVNVLNKTRKQIKDEYGYDIP